MQVEEAARKEAIAVEEDLRRAHEALREAEVERDAARTTLINVTVNWVTRAPCCYYATVLSHGDTTLTSSCQ